MNRMLTSNIQRATVTGAELVFFYENKEILLNRKVGQARLKKVSW